MILDLYVYAPTRVGHEIDDLAMPVDTSDSEDRNCYIVRAAAKYVTHHYDQFLASVRLRTSQFSTLARLKRNGPMTITELASDMAMDRTAVGRNIQPPERDGLIRTKATAAAGRAKQLLLTKASEKRLEAAKELVRSPKAI